MVIFVNASSICEMLFLPVLTVHLSSYNGRMYALVSKNIVNFDSHSALQCLQQLNSEDKNKILNRIIMLYPFGLFDKYE
jgi:hypothetical protein